MVCGGGGNNKTAVVDKCVRHLQCVEEAAGSTSLEFREAEGWRSFDSSSICGILSHELNEITQGVSGRKK